MRKFLTDGSSSDIALQPGDAALPRALVFDQNTTAYNQVQGGAAIVIATKTITLKANSQVRIEAFASMQGSVAAGRAVIAAADNSGTAFPNLPQGIQSFSTTAGTDYRTPGFVAVLGAQSAGDLVVKLILTVVGSSGARVDGVGATILSLTEIPATS